MGDGGVEAGVQGRVHERRHVHHSVIERVESHVRLQTVERVGDALVVGEDGVHQLIDIADQHFGCRPGHLHEKFVFDLDVAENQVAFRLFGFRQEFHQILLKMRFRRKKGKNNTT